MRVQSRPRDESDDRDIESRYIIGISHHVPNFPHSHRSALVPNGTRDRDRVNVPAAPLEKSKDATRSRDRSRRQNSPSRNPTATPRRAPNDAPRPRLQGTGAGAAGKPPCAPRTRPSRMPECRTCGTNREKNLAGRVGSPGWAVSGQTSQAGHAAFHARTPQVPKARAASHDDLR
jgi:hypothetical protein